MNDTLQFYAFSADKKAGDGIGDSVKSAVDYDKLNEIPNWRRMFSSFWSEDPFIYENRTYTSLEHAYQASKYFINGYVDYAFEFCLESNSQLSKLTGKDVQKAGRKIKLSDEQIKHLISRIVDGWKVAFCDPLNENDRFFRSNKFRKMICSNIP